jgi:hypothetical protein
METTAFNTAARTDFETEWCLLQNQFDSYEKHSLCIKLLSVIVLLTTELAAVISTLTILLLLVLWLQDAIWKTFQSRIESRLLQVEKAISHSSEKSAFQFNSEYHRVRLTGLSLIQEYIRQSIRPTVAFPHCVLIAIAALQYLL